MKRAWLLGLLLLVGCDSVVSNQIEGPRFIKRETVSCTHPSFCFTSMPGFDGKMNFGYKFSAFCPGTQEQINRYTPLAQIHKSGKVTHTFDIETLEAGACQ